MEPNQTPVQPPPQKAQTIEPKKSLPKLPLIIAAVILVATLITGGAYFLNQQSNNKIACTQEAKLCPDGSSVGRTGPKCEFAKCPAITLTPTIDISNWKTYTNTKYDYSINYPGDWYNREFSDQKTGSAFTKSNKPNDYASETITIDALKKSIDSVNIPFETYVKTAATKEIQNYKKLSTIKEIKTTSGLIGYETTWMIQSIGPGGTGESLPRTYFQAPNDNTVTIQVSLGKEEDLGVYEKMLSSFKFTGQTSPTPATTEETFLKIPEYGVQIALSNEIKDAYYVNTTAAKGYVYLKVHSLDSEPQCLKDDSSTAALSKVGKDEVNQMSDKKYSDSYKGVTIGNYFYYIDLAQYICAGTPEGKAKLEKVRTAFTNAEITQ